MWSVPETTVDHIDIASSMDAYSLGITMYEALTMDDSYPGKTQNGLMDIRTANVRGAIFEVNQRIACLQDHVAYESEDLKRQRI